MTMRGHQFVSTWRIPHLVELTSNTPSIPNFIYGSLSPQRRAPQAHLLKVRYHVQRNIDNAKQSGETLSHTYHKVNNERIYYERVLGPGLQLKLLLQYGDQGISMSVNSTYHHLIRRQLGDIRSPGHHLSDVLGIRLISHGYASIHASAFSINNQATVLFALPDTGKTVSVLHAVSRGSDFLSEDIAITNGTLLWGCPNTLGLAPYIHHTGFPYLRYNIYKSVPIVRHFLQGINNIDAQVVLRSDKITSCAEVKRLMILTSSTENSKQEMDNQEAITTIFTFNRREFPYWNPLLFALQNLKQINLSQLIRKEKQIIRDLVRHTDELIVLSGTPDYFKQHIDNIIAMA
jgi:hypothetical protein